MKSFLFVSIWFGVLGLSLALLEPIPLPVDLQECYETRSFNMTPSFATALHIQIFVLKVTNTSKSPLVESGPDQISLKKEQTT